MNRDLAVRYAFAATCAVFAVGLGARLAGKEPYPALLMPAFGEIPFHGSAIDSVAPQFTVHFADGHTADLWSVELLPNTPDIPGEVLERILGPNSSPETIDPETTRWLRSRLTKIYPSQDPESVDVSWGKTVKDIHDGSTRYEPIGAFHVNFHAPR